MANGCSLDPSYALELSDRSPVLVGTSRRNRNAPRLTLCATPNVDCQGAAYRRHAVRAHSSQPLQSGPAVRGGESKSRSSASDCWCELRYPL